MTWPFSEIDHDKSMLSIGFDFLFCGPCILISFPLFLKKKTYLPHVNFFGVFSYVINSQIIDTNASAIRALEPIAEEILALDQLEALSGQASSFKLQLEKRNLSTIHLNAITRIYGEHGQEILELLRKNPAGSIPLILKRLKQKDLEWRKTRQELGKQWKETIDKNYQRIFDHRSFYFRQQDRRCYSVKYLAADIKGTAVETGSNLHELHIPGISVSVPPGKVI